MTKINPYLHFPGNTEEAFNFYKSVFGGEFMGEIMRWKNAPEPDKISEAEHEKVMHISLPIGNGNVLMGSDALESMGQKLTAGNNFNIIISPDSKEDAERIFNALSAGGTVVMPMQDTFWGDYFGLCTDKYGIRWMIDFEYERKE
jgi:PhnB protein